MQRFGKKFYDLILSVPVSYKIAGIMLLSVLILGLSLNYWVTSGLADWLSYLLTDVRVQAAMTAGRRSVTLVTFLAAAMSILLATLLTHVLTQPLHELRAMALKVADGDLDARAPVYSKDEIGDVATAINTMTDHLVQAQTDLTRTNRRLTAINRVIQAADREQEIHDVLYVILSTVLDVLNLEMGWVYLRDPEHDLYHLASWCNVPPELGEYLMHPPQRANSVAVSRCFWTEDWHRQISSSASVAASAPIFPPPGGPATSPCPLWQAINAWAWSTCSVPMTAPCLGTTWICSPPSAPRSPKWSPMPGCASS